VTSYTIEYTTVADDSFVELASGLTVFTYLVEDLTYGTVYKFRVQAINAFDSGPFSTELELLCATIPLAPAAPTTSVLND
jgi:hypothetical protein